MPAQNTKSQHRELGHNNDSSHKHFNENETKRNYNETKTKRNDNETNKLVTKNKHD